MNQEDIIREIYTSDIILADMEAEMLAEVDDSYLNMMEEFHERKENEKVVLSENELYELEDKFNEFYFEYGFVQFKRGLEVGLSLRDIH
ncbi:MAG: hypothetical protein UFX20_08835 [Longibaculum muris]|uniref:Uncharacterized protein n=1 Tax=Longibaculum muris TaxID=1796628 RepID=A0A4R3Z6U0_9FIRM|nr:hypothetical protein [Longibaculum muris]KXU51423.1 hypothetical protein HMPREF3037_00982 [Candidatus Stoquefichus sp. KLE1796]MBS5369101.1 hypothetical protein [Coprobacillus cateniformis]MCR1887786.1 hypothetical protein [Longibaculum muris]MED9812192.1 hypothetical protein [Longibaculum muris]TCW01308.1 hypothetical protein EDD60_104127 [Longibaculum muris]